SMLENLTADYARTARAKGLDENVVVYRHVFRNSLLALITVAANILPALIGGSVVVESIFSIPGMGQLGVQAVQSRDREVVLAVCAAFAPVLANSAPLIMKRRGEVSFPFLRYLTSSDVVLQVACWSAVVLYLWPRVRGGLKAWIFVGIVAVTFAVAWFAVRP